MTIPAENDTKRAGKQVVTFFFFGDHLQRRRARGLELNFSDALYRPISLISWKSGHCVKTCSGQCE